MRRLRYTTRPPKISYAIADLALERGSLAEAEQFARQAVAFPHRKFCVRIAQEQVLSCSAGSVGKGDFSFCFSALALREQNRCQLCMCKRSRLCLLRVEFLLQKLARDSERYRFLDDAFQTRPALGGKTFLFWYTTGTPRLLRWSVSVERVERETGIEPATSSLGTEHSS